MSDLPDLLLSIEDPLPAEWASEFLGSISRPQLRSATDRPKPTGPQAGPEWLLPTAVFLFLFKSYFDGFLKEAGKDHYQALKPALSRFWARLFGKDRVFSTKVFVSTPAKLAPGPRYSLSFSLAAEGASRRRFKLLLPEDVSAEDFDASVEAFLAFIQAQHSGKDLDLPTRALIAGPDTYGIVLVAFDLSARRLRTIDYRSGHAITPGSEEHGRERGA